MNTRVFIAANAREGLMRVRRELGDDAVVLSTRPHPQGVELLASAYGDLAVPAPARCLTRPAVRVFWPSFPVSAACCKTSWPALPGGRRDGAIQ